MADSVNVQHKLQMLFETKLDEKSKQQVGKQIKGMLENAVISFDEAEARHNLESIIKMMNRLFSKAEMEGFDVEKLLKMPSQQALQEIASRTTDDFQKAFDQALKKSGGIKIDFGNVDLSAMTEPLNQLAKDLTKIGDKIANSAEKSVSDIEESLSRLGTDRNISKATQRIEQLLTTKTRVPKDLDSTISKLVDLRDAYGKSRVDNNSWEIQYQHLLKYVQAYEIAQQKFGESLIADNPQLKDLYEILSPKAKAVKISLENFVNVARGDELAEDKHKPWAREKTLQEVKQVLEGGITVNGRSDEKPEKEPSSVPKSKSEEAPKPANKPKSQKTRDPITEGINKFIKEYTAGIEALFDAPVEAWNKLRTDMLAKLSDTFKLKDTAQAKDLLQNFELFELNEDEKKLVKYLKEQIEAPISTATEAVAETTKKTIETTKKEAKKKTDGVGDETPSSTVSIDENSLKNVLTDITYKVKVESEDQNDSPEDNQAVQTLGEISQKIDAISKEATLQEIKGTMESKGVGDHTSLDDEAIPTTELTQQEKFVEQYNQNKQKTVDLLKKEQLSYEEILYLVKEIQTEYASAFYKDKNYDLGDDASGLMTSVYGKLRRGDMIDARLDKAINGVGMTAEEGARILTDFQNRQSGIMEDISNKIQAIEDDDAESIEKENGALEDKLERLQELSDAWGQKISQAKRDRYEALNQKEMNSGLTSKEEDRMSELYEEIESADASLEEFGETYDKIILKLANGKKVDILPDDSGLGKLFKFGDEYGESYNGIEIEDVIFERVQKAVDVVKDNVLKESPSDEDKPDKGNIEALKGVLSDITYNVNVVDDADNDNTVAIDEASLENVLSKVVYNVKVDGVENRDASEDNKVSIDAEALRGVLNAITYNVKVVQDADAPDSEKTALIDIEALKTVLSDIIYNVKITHDEADKTANKIALDDTALESTLKRVFANILKPQISEATTSSYSAMPRDEATKYIDDHYDHKVWDNWYSKALDPFRTQIAQTLENDIKLRNAALNQMWDEYKHLTGSDVSFEDFLNTKIPLYRGEPSDSKSQSEKALSFSLTPKTAEEFGEQVLKVWLRPADTLGMANPTYVHQPEAEVLVPKELVPEYGKWRESFQSNLDTNDNNAPWAKQDTLSEVKGILENIREHTGKIGTEEAQQTVTIDANSVSTISSDLTAIKMAVEAINDKVVKGTAPSGQTAKKGAASTGVENQTTSSSVALTNVDDRTIAHYENDGNTFDDIDSKLAEKIKTALTSLLKYKTMLQEANQLSGDLEVGINKLANELNQVTNKDELATWGEHFKQFKNASSIIQTLVKDYQALGAIQAKADAETDPIKLSQYLDNIQSLQDRIAVKSVDVNVGDDRFEEARQRAYNIARHELQQKEEIVGANQVEAETIRQLVELYEQLGAARAKGEDTSAIRASIKSLRDGLSSVDYAIDMKFKAATEKGSRNETIKAENQELNKRQQSFAELIKLYEKYATLSVRAGFVDGQMLSDQLNAEAEETYQNIMKIEKLLGTISSKERQELSEAMNKGIAQEEKKQLEKMAKSIDKDETSRVKELNEEYERLGKKYEELGKLQAQYAQTDSLQTEHDIQILEQAVDAEKQRLGLTSQQIAALESRRNIARAEAAEALDAERREKNRLHYIKEEERAQKEALKKEIKQNEENARMSRARSIKGRAIDTITNVNLLDDLSGDTRDAAVQNLINQLKDFDVLRTKIQNGDAELKDIESFKILQTEIDKASKELNEFASIHSLISDKKADPIKITTPFDPKNMESYRIALENAVRTHYRGKAIIGDFDYKTGQLNYTVKSGRHEVTEYKTAWDKLGGTFAGIPGKAKTVDGILKKLLNKAKEFGAYFTGSSIIYKAWNAILQGISYVREIDSALTELKKVTDETEESYRRFLDTAAKTADKVGSTVKEIVSSTADWARIGYSLEDATALAESTAILLNVSEFSSIEDATSALTSTLQAFSYTAEQSLDVVDVLNEVGKLVARR